jgi:hypothetical protein
MPVKLNDINEQYVFKTSKLFLHYSLSGMCKHEFFFTADILQFHYY